MTALLQTEVIDLINAKYPSEIAALYNKNILICLNKYKNFEQFHFVRRKNNFFFNFEHQKSNNSVAFFIGENLDFLFLRNAEVMMFDCSVSILLAPFSAVSLFDCDILLNLTRKPLTIK